MTTGTVTTPAVAPVRDPVRARLGFLVAAALAGGGDWLFVAAGDSSDRRWTAYFGTYIALAGAVALVGALGAPGRLRSACRGAATGAVAVIAFLGMFSIGVLLVPLATWLALSTFRAPDGRRRRVEAAAAVIAVLVPFAGLFTVYQ